jgi:hypothetical protein
MMPGFPIAAPLLAFKIDAETIIGVVVVAFWFLSWLIKLVSGQNQKTPPVGNRPRPPVRPRDERLQNEIDVFIKEVGPKKPARPPQPTPERRAAPVQAAARKKKEPQTQAAPLPPSPPAQKRVRPGQQIASRQAPVSGDLGKGVKQHLQQYMAEKISREVEAHLQHNINKSVSQHLGPDTTTGQVAQPAPILNEVAQPVGGRAASLAELFRNPSNLRQAIVVNLILSPPIVRQHRTKR